MMKRFVKRGSAVLAGISLICTSSLANAGAPVAPVAANASAWSALAFLNGGQSAAAYCGASAIGVAGAAAAQGPAANCVLPQLDPVAPPVMDQQVLPPPLPGAATGVSSSGISPLFIALGALAAAAAIYFLVNSGGNGDDDDNSPA